MAMIRTATLARWLSRPIERLHLDVERHALSVSGSFTLCRDNQSANIAKTSVYGAKGHCTTSQDTRSANIAGISVWGATEHWITTSRVSQFVTTVGTCAQNASGGFTPPWERRYTSTVDAETSSGCMSAKKA